MATPKSNLSFLDIVDICDNVHLRRDNRGLYDISFNDEVLIPLYLSESPNSAVIGLLRPIIVQELERENARSREIGTPELWALRLNASEQIRLRNGISGPSASLRDWADSPSKRTAAMNSLCQRWRDTGLFADVCGPTKWRSEMYPVYADPFGVHDHPQVAGREDGLNYAFEMERSACALFGIVTYGVHMSIYEEILGDKGESSIQMWIPTRALTKPTSVLSISNADNAMTVDLVGLGTSITQLRVASQAGCRSLNPLSRSVWKKLASMLTSL